MNVAMLTLPVLVDAVPAWTAPIRELVPSHSSKVHAAMDDED